MIHPHGEVVPLYGPDQGPYPRFQGNNLHHPCYCHFFWLFGFHTRFANHSSQPAGTETLIFKKLTMPFRD
jgi:hypothetical protein